MMMSCILGNDDNSVNRGRNQRHPLYRRLGYGGSGNIPKVEGVASRNNGSSRLLMVENNDNDGGGGGGICDEVMNTDSIGSSIGGNRLEYYYIIINIGDID